MITDSGNISTSLGPVLHDNRLRNTIFSDGFIFVVKSNIAMTISCSSEIRNTCPNAAGPPVFNPASDVHKGVPARAMTGNHLADLFAFQRESLPVT